MILTITGKPGSGKTTAAHFFLLNGANVIDADKLGHKLLQKNEIKEKILKEFPEVSKFSRKTIAATIFKSKDNLLRYNSIIHPPLISCIKQAIKKNKFNVIDAALYYELELDKISDKVLLIKADASKIDHRTKKEFRQRGKFQKNILRPDYLILNDADKKSFFSELEKVHINLIK